MKPCPSPSCKSDVPAHYKDGMVCGLCMAYGPPAVRLSLPERIVRTSKDRREVSQ